MLKGIHHIAIGVDDFEAGVDFYTKALEAEFVWGHPITGDRVEADRVIGLDAVEAKVAMLKLANIHVEVWEYEHPKPVDRRSEPNGLGYPHIALEVEDIDAEYARLVELGVDFVGPVVDLSSSKAVYGTDPFGNIIELYELFG